MRVLTYVSTSDQTAPSKRFVARIQHDGGEMAPVIFEGQNLAHLIEKAEAWWAEEVTRAEKRQAPRKKAETRAENAPQTVDEDFDVV